MYKISVPIMLKGIDRYGDKVFIDKLKELQANVVFFALDSYETDEKKRENVFALLKKEVPAFKAAGFTVGVWVWTFMVRADKKYTHITSPNGPVSGDQVCPSDEEFRAFSGEYLKSIAESHPDMIMFDDDYRYGFLDCGLGCACKNHRKYMGEILGEDVSDKELGKLVFGGKGNKYRSAFLKANGHYLREFAKSTRKAVDCVDENIRVGLCSCMSTWDFDGVSAAELSRILAGKTKPFLRLSGAPYWADLRAFGGNRLQDVVELERMESSWCGDGIETFAEGDAYPRPRYTCSSNELEAFDMAMRVSGATNGIHKYPLDYYADPSYENGYVAKHIKNAGIYKEISNVFQDKTPVGVRVYEMMNKFENMTVPDYYEGSDYVQSMFFSPAAKLLAAQTIPSVYNGLGVAGIAFGENAKYIDEGALENGLILDITAAAILNEKGIDVGLKSIDTDAYADEEYIPSEKRYVGLFGSKFKTITASDKVKVVSYFVSGEKEYVGAYTYENSDGQKFLIFAFDGYSASEHEIKQYVRGEQIENFISSLGKRLPASMHGNPDCYMICKKGENATAVWIGNYFEDECLNTTVILNDDFDEIKFINCEGKLNKNKVEIDYIAPYASVGFEVKKN